MAYWCIDYVNGSDGTGASQTTAALAATTPFKTWAAVTQTAGDTYLFKSGVTHSASVTISQSGTATSKITISTYGGTEKAIIDLAYGGTTGLTMSSRSYIDISNLKVTRVGTTQASSNPAVSCYGTSSYVTFTDCVSVDNYGIGFYLQGPGINNITYTRCSSIGNSATGYHSALGASNCYYIYCDQLGCGSYAGSHGFSSHPQRTNATWSDWSLVGGTTYSRAFASWEVKRLVYQVGTPYTELTRNTATPTTPGSNEFGWSSNVLYVNVGTNPNGASFFATDDSVQGLYYYYCKSVAAKNYEAYATDEGHGFAVDDYGGNCYFYGCLADQCQGHGFSFNGAHTSAAIGCIAANHDTGGGQASTAKFGYSLASTRGVNIYHSIAKSYTSHGINHSNCITASNLKNNIVYNNGGYGIRSVTTAPTAASNCYYNNTSGASTGVTDSTAVTSNPLLDANYRPTDSSPCLNAGTFVSGVKDYYGKRIKNPPDIGAIQNFGTRTIASSRTLSANRGI